MSAPVASLVILSQPSCVQCTSTYRALNKTGIPYASFNLGDPGEAAAAMAFHRGAGPRLYAGASRPSQGCRRQHGGPLVRVPPRQNRRAHACPTGVGPGPGACRSLTPRGLGRPLPGAIRVAAFCLGGLPIRCPRIQLVWSNDT